MIKTENQGGYAKIKDKYVDHHHIKTVSLYLPETSKDEIINKSKLKGRNRNRRKIDKLLKNDKRLCTSVIKNRNCVYGDKCKFIHDKNIYWQSKSDHLSGRCYNFDTYGICQYGLACRFAKQHTDEALNNVVKKVVNEVIDVNKVYCKTGFTKEIQTSLRKKQYDFTKTNDVLARICNSKESNMLGKRKWHKISEDTEMKLESKNYENILETHYEKKIDFTNKLYLAPLTTVGNLPFRRICKEFGADITCGEMAVSTNLLQGKNSEWALTKRHESEDIFGVQICGSHPDSIARCVQVLNDTSNIDFIDLNCGCPIDLVFKRGEGSALIGRQNRLEQIVKVMREVSNCDITIKMRTGIYENKNVAHNLIPLFIKNNVSAISIHGRSKEQRYTKSADWEYIGKCQSLIKNEMNLFANGDILTYEDAIKCKELTGTNSLMIARGALIKPWIFTEIKENRHWDISSQERFDILKKYAHFGLEHWGSDSQGVETTRKFMLEWLSFLHRYIPIDLLEHLPQKINERPPYYFGRNDLETLMASTNCDDWIKISEMLLGPVPDGFIFLPKHKANSYQ